MTFASPGPIAFSLELLTVGWYGLLLALAAVVGLLLARREAARRGEPMEPFLTACSAALAGGIIGVRLYHMAFHWDYYGRAPLKALALWEGWGGIFGGTAGGVLAAALCRRLAGRSLAQFLDIVAPSLVLVSGRTPVRRGLETGAVEASGDLAALADLPKLFDGVAATVRPAAD